MPNERPLPPPSVPPQVLAASRAALRLHDPSLPVATLAADSLLDSALPRPTDADRRLVFDTEDLCVDVTLWRDPTAMQMQVQVYRADESPRSEAETPTDAGEPAAAVPNVTVYDFLELVQPPSRIKVMLSDGEARLFDVPFGLTSLVLHGQVGTSAVGLRTAWFTV